MSAELKQQRPIEEIKSDIAKTIADNFTDQQILDALLKCMDIDKGNETMWTEAIRIFIGEDSIKQ